MGDPSRGALSLDTFNPKRPGAPILSSFVFLDTTRDRANTSAMGCADRWHARHSPPDLVQPPAYPWGVAPSGPTFWDAKSKQREIETNDQFDFLLEAYWRGPDTRLDRLHEVRDWIACRLGFHAIDRHLLLTNFTESGDLDRSRLEELLHRTSAFSSAVEAHVHRLENFGSIELTAWMDGAEADLDKFLDKLRRCADTVENAPLIARWEVRRESVTLCLLFIHPPAHGSEVSPAARNTLDSARIPRASKLLSCGLFQKVRVLAQDGVNRQQQDVIDYRCLRCLLLVMCTYPKRLC